MTMGRQGSETRHALDRPHRGTRLGMTLALVLGASLGGGALAGGVASAGASATGVAAAQARAIVGSPSRTHEPAPKVKGQEWPVYHHDAAGSGNASISSSLSTVRRSWTSPPLEGAVYGEPLVASGRVLVATEADTVYALSRTSGAVVWSTHVGSPVPSKDLPCGDISPTVGITGTPVVDPARREIFVVADKLVAGEPQHQLFGLNLTTGKVVLDEQVDPPGSDHATLLQRTGLNLDLTSVVFGFGGNDGDCGAYHGWVVSVPVGGGRASRYEIDAARGERQGAVWMGGAAPEVSDGDIWFAVGNGSVTAPTPYDGSDSVTELNRHLGIVQRFAPEDWYDDNARDLDLGSTAPALVGDGSVVQVGKSGIAYLLRRGALGGVGGGVATTAVCTGGVADGGDAVAGSVVYLPCQSGLEAVQVAHGALRVIWREHARPSGPPIVAGRLVWSVGGATLYGVDPTTGALVERLPIGANANHFPTPSAVGHQVLVTGGGGDRVVAFTG